MGFNPARPILVRTGKLKKSFKTTNMTKRSFISKNVDDKAPYLHYGTSRGIPARKIIGVSDKSEKALVLLVKKHISGNLNKFALGK